MKVKDIAIIVLFILIVSPIIILASMENKQVINQTIEESGFKITNDTTGLNQKLFTYTPEYDLEINGELYEQVDCECYKNNPMCLMICYELKLDVIRD